MNEISNEAKWSMLVNEQLQLARESAFRLQQLYSVVDGAEVVKLCIEALVKSADLVIATHNETMIEIGD